MKDVIELAKQAGASTERVTLFPPTFKRTIEFNVTQLETFVKLVRNAALDELSDKLKQSGAALPAKQKHEGGNAVLTGVSIALVVIEELKEPTP